jgi:muramoyltetrapeptide carboxypeptidase
MSEAVSPPRLAVGDQVRVVAPARSLGIIDSQTRGYADERFARDLGLALSFGENAERMDPDDSSPVEARIDDLHAAFADPAVRGVFTVIGGYNSNQLLDRIDWGLIGANPKVFCGFSDITALQNAMLAQSKVVSYSGPHYSTLGQKLLDPYTLEGLRTALFTDAPYDVVPSAQWTDDEWYLDQDNRHPQPNEGHWVIQPGQAEGTIVGGNACTMLLLQGTDYQPISDADTVLFLEDTAAMNHGFFERHLQALLQGWLGVSIGGLVIGRFQPGSGITRQSLERMITSKPELAGLPVVANVDFGHTEPRITFPIGGTVSLAAAEAGDSRITIQKH